jgi:hypothetical protein
MEKSSNIVMFHENGYLCYAFLLFFFFPPHPPPHPLPSPIPTPASDERWCLLPWMVEPRSASPAMAACRQERRVSSPRWQAPPRQLQPAPDGPDLGGPLAELHWWNSGIQFELPDLLAFRIGVGWGEVGGITHIKTTTKRHKTHIFSRKLKIFQILITYLLLRVIFQNVVSPKAAGPATPSP